MHEILKKRSQPKLNRDERRQLLPECSEFIEDLWKTFGEIESVCAVENGNKFVLNEHLSLHGLKGVQPQLIERKVSEKVDRRSGKRN